MRDTYIEKRLSLVVLRIPELSVLDTTACEESFQ